MTGIQTTILEIAGCSRVIQGSGWHLASITCHLPFSNVQHNLHVWRRAAIVRIPSNLSQTFKFFMHAQ